jgi:biopolymer transport protein TolQ
MEPAMRLVLNAELRCFETRLPFLALLALAAPFVGFFGTVWGIVISFSAIAAETQSSPTTRSPSISGALPGACRV